ncbi:MAG: hypothetical protein RIQ60_2471 [Pseudomonadota bacterium]|jgi:hypothetical protein
MPHRFQKNVLALLCTTVLALTSTAGPAQAQGTGTNKATALDDRGYSYFLGLAQQSVRYRESGSTQAVNSSVRATSPLLITGALFPIGSDLLVSMHSENTFFPGRATERWTATGPTLGGITLTDPLVQSNGFNLSQSTTELLAHRRLTGPLFGTGGVTFHTQAYKRYSFVAGVDQAVTIPAGRTVEESTSELVLMLGGEMESESVRNSGNHYGLRAGVGLPVWRRTQNTEAPQIEFAGAKGFDAEVEARYSWAVLHGAHVGLWGKYTLAYRARETQSTASNTYELPSSRADTLAAGVELLWKF